MNTTGADLIVVGINYHNSFIGGVSDSKGNTYTLIRTEAAGVGAYAACRLYYATGVTVGTGHTFSTTAGISNIFVLAVSGARTTSTPLDQQNGANTAVSASVATGSITTSVADCLVFTVYGGFNPGGAPSMTSGGSGFTVPSGWSIATSTSEAGAASYKIESGTASENVTWTSTSSPHSAAIIASFMPPAVAASVKLLSLTGAGT